jgi:hypothetical protein
LEEIQQEAVSSFRHFAAKYYPNSTPEIQTRVVDKLIKSAAETNPSAARGATRALGVLPAVLLRPQLSSIVQTLIRCSRIQANPELRDAETRKFAVSSLAQICLSMSSAFDVSVINHEFSPIIDSTMKLEDPSSSDSSGGIDIDEFGNIIQIASAASASSSSHNKNNPDSDWNEFDRTGLFGLFADGVLICELI